MNMPLRKLYQRIAEDIATSIAAGRFPPGSRLPAERDLADELSVSRPTIREAMIALEMRGLVEARQGSGVYVTQAQPGPIDVPVPELDVGAFELVEARIMVEGEAAALAAKEIDEVALTQLRAHLAQMEAAPHDAAAFEADKHFHLAIAEATGNSLIRSIVEMLWSVRERSPLCRRMFDQARREGVTPRAAEHQLIIDAIARHDPPAAREAMRGHLRRVIDDLLEATELELMQRAKAEVSERRERVASRTTL